MVQIVLGMIAAGFVIGKCWGNSLVQHALSASIFSIGITSIVLAMYIRFDAETSSCKIYGCKVQKDFAGIFYGMVVFWLIVIVDDLRVLYDFRKDKS